MPAPLSDDARAALRTLARSIDSDVLFQEACDDVERTERAIRELCAAALVVQPNAGAFYELTPLGAVVLSRLLSALATDEHAASQLLNGGRPGRRPRVALEHVAHAAKDAPGGMDDPLVERALFLDVLDAVGAVAPGEGWRGMHELPKLHRVAVFARDWLTRHPLNVPTPGPASPVPEGSTLPAILRRERGYIAAAANAASLGSTRKGRCLLSADSSRDDVVAWLAWNDPEGDFETMEERGAWALLAHLLEDRA